MCRLKHKHLHEHAKNCGYLTTKGSPCTCDLMDHRKQCLMFQKPGEITARDLDYLIRECEAQDIEVDWKSLWPEIKFYIKNQAKKERGES